MSLVPWAPTAAALVFVVIATEAVLSGALGVEGVVDEFESADALVLNVGVRRVDDDSIQIVGLSRAQARLREFVVHILLLSKY